MLGDPRNRGAAAMQTQARVCLQGQLRLLLHRTELWLAANLPMGGPVCVRGPSEERMNGRMEALGDAAEWQFECRIRSGLAS